MPCSSSVCSWPGETTPAEYGLLQGFQPGRCLWRTGDSAARWVQRRSAALPGCRSGPRLRGSEWAIERAGREWRGRGPCFTTDRSAEGATSTTARLKLLSASDPCWKRQRQCWSACLLVGRDTVPANGENDGGTARQTSGPDRGTLGSKKDRHFTENSVPSSAGWQVVAQSDILGGGRTGVGNGDGIGQQFASCYKGRQGGFGQGKISGGIHRDPGGIAVVVRSGSGVFRYGSCVFQNAFGV